MTSMAPGNPRTTTDDLIRVARVIKAHGIKGALRLELMGDDPDRMVPGTEFILESSGARLTLGTCDPQPNGDVLATFVESRDRTFAEKLRDDFLCVPLSEARALADSEWFVHDLVGCTVVTPDATVGEVLDVESYTGNDCLVVRRASGVIRIPMVKNCVLGVDLSARTIRVAPWALEEA